MEREAPPPVPVLRPSAEPPPALTLLQRVQTTRLAQVKIEERTDLAGVAQLLTTLSGIPIRLDASAQAKSHKLVADSLDLHDVRLGDVLDLATRPLGLLWSEVDDGVTITDPAAGKAGVVVEIHAVSDLVPVVGRDRLLERVRDGIAAEHWNAAEHAIRYQGEGALVVRAKPVAQEQVAATLDTIRGEQPLKLRFYDVKDLPNHDAMRSVIESQYLDGARGHTVELKHGIFVVRAPTGVLGQIDRYLQQRRSEE